MARRKRTNDLEATFKLAYRSARQTYPDAPELVEQYKFYPHRRWKSDFAIPDKQLLVEIEGGVNPSTSRHKSIVGYHNDTVKYNAAVLHGWQVLRFDTFWVTRCPHEAALLVLSTCGLWLLQDDWERLQMAINTTRYMV